jgi:DNA topoisomerase-3
MCSEMLSTLKGNRNEVRFVGVEKNRSEFVCPVCGKPVLIGEMKYYCSGYRDGCKYAILKRVGQKNLTANQLKTLITKGKTAFIKGFINHEGKKFDGYLVYNKELMRLEFSFK